MVHMGPTYARLARMEIDDLVVSIPLVEGIPQRRNPARGHSDVVAEVRGAPLGCDHPILVSTHSEVRSKFSYAQCLSARAQDPKVHLGRLR